MNNLVISWIRTVVPAAVGALVAYLVSKGFNVPQDIQEAVVSVLTFVFTGAYYWIARRLEKHNPKLGWLLGVAAQPTYKK